MTDNERGVVTMRDLDEKLDQAMAKVPSRWEVRFLIVVGMIAGQIVPAHEAAKAAIKLLGG